MTESKQAVRGISDVDDDAKNGDIPVHCRGTTVLVPHKYLEWLDTLRTYVETCKGGMQTPFKLDCSADELHEVLNYIRDKKPTALEEFPSDKFAFRYLNVGVVKRQACERDFAERIARAMDEMLRTWPRDKLADTKFGLAFDHDAAETQALLSCKQPERLTSLASLLLGQAHGGKWRVVLSGQVWYAETKTNRLEVKLEPVTS
jgi:hypothetical protein